jgi:hypothetical protein
MWHSVLGTEPPDTFNFDFRSLEQLNEQEKSEITERDVASIVSLHNAGIISTSIALKELKQGSILTGRFTNITDEDIKESEEMPAPWSEEAQQQQQQQAMMGGGMPGGDPNDPNGGAPGGEGGGMPGTPTESQPPGAGMPGAGVPAPSAGEPTNNADR